jgi:lipoprotein-anchoring transpeptidase ErfK/SrfK
MQSATTATRNGCVNVRDITAAAYLFDHVPVGAPVVIYHTG